MIEERLTEDLLARLLAAPNPDSYLGEGLTLQRSLADYLHELLAAKGLKRRETQRLLKLAGAAELYPKVRRDAIIIWCIDRGMSREACDDELWRFGEKTLLGTCPLQ